MGAHYPNWTAVLNDIVSYITQFKIGLPLIPVDQFFLITKISTGHFTITNTTVPLSPILVYEVDAGVISTYNTENKWESFLLLAGKNGVWSGRIPPGFGSVVSVQGKTGIVLLAKGDLDLGSVDNTPDLNKPVSIPTANALSLKLNARPPIVGGTATKITWGTDGLVLDGSPLSTDEIVESVNRRFISTQQYNDLNNIIEFVIQGVVDGGTALEDTDDVFDGGNA